MADYLEAEKIAWNYIQDEIFKCKIPAWVYKNALCDTSQVKEGVWSVVTSLYKKRILKEGEAWEIQEDGEKVFTQIDEQTGKKWYVLIDDEIDESRMLDFFHVEVDLATKKVTVLNLVDYKKYKEDDFDYK